MNRIILFRGLTASNEWVKGDLIKGMGAKHGKMYILPHVVNVAYLKGCDPIDGYNVKPESIGQFCDLHDKHGKRIFEGDWCRACYRDAQGYHYKQGYIFMDEYMWCLNTLDKTDSYGIYSINRLHDFEIIGSIHTNPELLQP